MASKELIVAREAGRFVGALLDCGANLCPWLRNEQGDRRDAWLLGFGEGRIARLRLAEKEWPTFEITLSAFKDSA